MSHSRSIGSRRPRMAVALAVAAVALVTGSTVLGASPAPSGSGELPSFAAYDPNAARSECEEKGGQVQERRAAWGTNGDPATWTVLAGDIELCRFQTLGPDDDSRIYVDLRTLTTHGPTLASVAYLTKVQPAPPKKSKKKHHRNAAPIVGMGNPAAARCTALGGSSSFGTTAGGGGWVNLEDPIDTTVAMCVFPDGSMIDEWGIAYYAAGVVRGADLALLLDYQPGTHLPPFFS